MKEYYFFADSDEKQQWIFTVPEGQDISLLLYAGMIGKTQDIGIYLDSSGYKKIYDAILTRDRDIALNDETATTTRQKKNSDIHNRFDLMKTYDNCIFISIHQNKFTQSKYFGAQVFYGPKNPESQLLGEIMQANLIEMLQPENTRKSKPCTDSVYLIYNAPVPALLVECGFLSNADDAYKLVNADYQKRIAFAVFTGVSEYLNSPGRTEQPEGTKQVVWEFDPRSAMA